MSATDRSNVTQLCQHESSAVFTATGGWIESYVCECAKCHRLVVFFPDEEAGREPVLADRAD